MANKNEIALVKSEKNLIMQVAGKMVDDIEYKTLDTAIENLGKKSGELTPEERNQAVDVVRKFENRVVSCIKTKNEKLNHFRSILMTSPTGDFYDIERFMGMDDAIEQILSDKRYPEELLADFHDMQGGMAAIEAYKLEHEPEEPFIDVQHMTPADVAQKRFEYEVKQKRFQIAIGKHEFRIRKEFMTFKRALNKDKTFKAFIKALDQQATLAEEAINTVQEKVSMAQMNIVISSEDIRKTLREMHEWAKKI